MPSTAPICARSSRILAFRSSCCDWRPGRRLDERRALLGRVADPRALGRELRRDQEAEAEERRAERQLPARDLPDAAHHGHAAASRRRRATTMATTMTTAPTRNAIAMSGEPPRRRSGCVGRRAGGRSVARAPGHSVRAPTDPAGSGAAIGGPRRRHRTRRRRLRPGLTGGVGVVVREPGVGELGHRLADRGLERLVVGATVRVGPDEPDQGVLAVRPDQVVDRGDALRVGQARTAPRSSGTGRSGRSGG